MVRGRKKVMVYTRAAEHSGHFRVDDSILLCVYCNHTVKWEKNQLLMTMFVVLFIVQKRRHTKTNRKMEKFDNKEQLPQTISIAGSKKELIEDLIIAFAIADIPLKKVNSLLPFFQKHVKQGDFIPQAPTLRQIYLPQVFKNHLIQLKLLFENKPVAMKLQMIVLVV